MKGDASAVLYCRRRRLARPSSNKPAAINTAASNTVWVALLPVRGKPPAGTVVVVSGKDVVVEGSDVVVVGSVVVVVGISVTT